MTDYRKLTYTDSKIQVDSAIRDEDGIRIKTNYAKKTEIKDGVLTINTNGGSTLGTFSANQSANQTITLPNGSVQLLNQSATFISDNTYEEFPYRATVSVTGVTSSTYAEVTYSEEQATSLNFATFCDTGVGVIYLYSRTNVGTVTIPTISIGMEYSDITIDSAPTNGSGNAVSSGGVYTALATKQDMLTFDNTPTDGSSNPVTSDGIHDAIQSAIDTATIPWDSVTNKPSFVNNGTNSSVAPSGANSNGFWYVSSTTSGLSGADSNPLRQYHTADGDFRILTTAHSDNWLQQIATDFRTNNVFIRRKENGTWKDWEKMAVTSDLRALYPVGSIYMNATNSTNPGTLLGFGTWQQLAPGRVLMGAGNSSYVAGQQYGEYSHKLTVSEMPKHGHNNRVWNMEGTQGVAKEVNSAGTGLQNKTNGGTSFVTGTTTWANTSPYAAQSGVGDPNGYTDFRGGDTAHNNVQPSLVVYMWVRTA